MLVYNSIVCVSQIFLYPPGVVLFSVDLFLSLAIGCSYVYYTVCACLNVFFAGGTVTVCPGSSGPFYIETCYIKWVTTSWTYSIKNYGGSSALTWTNGGGRAASRWKRSPPSCVNSWPSTSSLRWTMLLILDGTQK